MRKILLTATAALALALSVGTTMADDTDDQEAPAEIAPPADTVFDLGIDVTNYADSRADALRFLASVPAETRNILITSCEHYMDTPLSTQSHETLEFCGYVVGG
jgi:hypothetical protein